MVTHMNECLSFTMACWQKCPITILKSGGQMGKCTVQNPPELLIPVLTQIQCCQASPFTSESFSFIIVEGGKSCPSLRLVRLKGDYSWGIISNSLACLCFQKSPFSPPWNRVRMFPVLWFTQLDSHLQHTFAHYAVTYIFYLDLCNYLFMRDPHQHS